MTKRHMTLEAMKHFANWIVPRVVFSGFVFGQGSNTIMRQLK